MRNPGPTTRDGRRVVRCPVCGEETTAPVWTCERCRTPHHQECAEYFGGCAIFGCRDGHPPARLEENSWPKAAALLRRVARLRRVQSWFLLLCLGIFISFAVLVATDHWPWAALITSLSLLFFGGIYGILDIFARGFWSRLIGELGVDRLRHAGIRSDRVRGRLPRFEEKWWKFRWLARGGYATLVLALPALFVHWGFSAALAYFGLMAVAGAAQLRRHTEEVDLSLRRFEATYALRLQKGPKGGAPDEPLA